MRLKLYDYAGFVLKNTDIGEGIEISDRTVLMTERKSKITMLCTIPMIKELPLLRY